MGYMGGDNHGTTFIPFYIMIQLVTIAVKPFKKLEQNVIIMIILCDQLVFGDFIMRDLANHSLFI